MCKRLTKIIKEISQKLPKQNTLSTPYTSALWFTLYSSSYYISYIILYFYIFQFSFHFIPFKSNIQTNRANLTEPKCTLKTFLPESNQSLPGKSNHRECGFLHLCIYTYNSSCHMEWK